MSRVEAKQNRQWTALILTGGGWPGDYDLVRSLGHAGVLSAVASSDPKSIAFHSRFVTHKTVLPPFEPGKYETIVKHLVELGARRPTKPVLYYVGDSELLFTARYAKTLSRYYRFLLPEPTLLEAITNKAVFPHLAARYQLPTPQTMVVRSYRELVEKHNNVPFPCIVKPPYNREWFWNSTAQRRLVGTYPRKIESPDALLSFGRLIPDWGSGLLVQSYVDDADCGTTRFLGYCDEQSHCLGSFIGRDVRTNPPYTGDTTLCEIVEDRRLTELSIEYCRRVGMKGIVKIDYMWDREAKQFKILEMEPHYQKWHLLGAYAGVNLAMVAYWHQRDEHVEEQVPQLQRTSLLHFRPDLMAFWKGYRKREEWSVARYLRSIFRASHYRILDFRDVRPFLASMVNAGRIACTRVVHAVVRLMNSTRVVPHRHGARTAHQEVIHHAEP